MDGGYRSQLEQTREAVVELAHAVGLLAAGAATLQASIVAIEQALQAREPSSPDYAEALAQLRLHSSMGQQNVGQVYDAILALLTRLGPPDARA